MVTKITAETLDLFVEHLRRENPEFKVEFKNESWSQRLLGVLTRSFCPEYMTQFTTTIGSTVYFPSESNYLKDPEGSLIVLAHEFVHVCDAQRDRFFKLKYLMPQVLVIIPLLAYGILAGSHAWILLLPVIALFSGSILGNGSRAIFLSIFLVGVAALLGLALILTGWRSLTLLGMLALIPWPAYWRVKYELRGYAMTLAVVRWIFGSVPDDFNRSIVGQFVGFNYYRMSWDRQYIEKTLEAISRKVDHDASPANYPYSVVDHFLSEHSLKK